jgi:hypothetical protein
MRGGIIIAIRMPGLQASKLAVLATCATVLAGCSHTFVVGRGRALDVGLTEYRVIPQKIRAAAGALTVFAHNYGRLTHNLVVSYHGHVVDETQPIAPGDTAWLALTLAPGEYELASTILSDQSLGEYGTLTVTS